MTTTPPLDPWQQLFWDLAGILKCLPSSFVDGNEHVFRVARQLMAEHAALSTHTAQAAEVATSGFVQVIDGPQPPTLQWDDPPQPATHTAQQAEARPTTE